MPPNAGHVYDLKGVTLMVNGRSVHDSHCMHWHRGLFFCGKCGFYATSRMKELPHACPMKPTSPVQKSRLKRIREGKHPAGNRFALPLPDGELPPIWGRPWLVPDLELQRGIANMQDA